MGQLKKIHLHVMIDFEDSKKLHVLEYYSGKSKGFIIRRAIKLLQPKDLKISKKI